MVDLSVFDLTGRRAIVTGAGKGIGKAIAITLAKAGADVVVCSRTLSAVEETAAEIKRLGVKGVPLQTDVRVPAEVDKLFKEALDKLGGIDILVNNAGGTFVVDFMDISPGGWDALITENLKSVFLCCKEAGKIMLDAKKGSIINITSVAGIIWGPGNNPGYAAAKAGIINLTQTLSLLWAPSNVRVNAVAPGAIETEYTKSRPPEILAETTAKIPMKRFGLPEEIAAGCVFLASDAASYVTGTTLVIAGGPPISI